MRIVCVAQMSCVDSQIRTFLMPAQIRVTYEQKIQLLRSLSAVVSLASLQARILRVKVAVIVVGYTESLRQL